MKKMIIIGLAAVLLLGGGAAGYFFLLAPDEAEEVLEGEEHAADNTKDKDGHSKDSDDKHGDGHGGAHMAYIEMSPLLLPIIDEYGISQTVTITIALEVSDADNVAGIESMKPKLNDAYIQDMYGVLNEHAALKRGVLQVGMVKNRLHRVTNDVLGNDKVDAVLLKMVNQRPI